MAIKSKKGTKHSVAHSHNKPKMPIYTAELISLKLENDHMLRVHRRTLERFSRLASSETQFHEINLEHLSLEVGHIITHFLYTGNYDDILRDKEQASSVSDMKTALRVYVAARDLELEALEALAKEEIQSLGRELPLVTVTEIVETTYARPDQDDTWFPDFITSLLQRFYDSITSLSVPEMPNITGQQPTICQMLLQNFAKMHSAALDDSESSFGWDNLTAPTTIQPGSEPEPAGANESEPPWQTLERNLMLPTVEGESYLFILDVRRNTH
jgi:hypothetical protein